MSFLFRCCLLLSLTPVFYPVEGSEYSGGAISALRQFLKAEHLAEGEQVLGMVGFYGEPGPPQWLILSSIAEGKEVLRESVFARGEVVAERKFRRLPGQDLPSLPIELSSLRIDSGEAFRAAEKRAIERKIAFDSVHYQLRCREQQHEPVWMLSLVNRSQVTVGVLYVSAASGEMLRESWPGLPVEKFAAPLETR